MNAVNLIPADSRKRRPAASTSRPTLALIGGLVVVLIAAVLYAMAANQVKTRQSELTRVTASAASWRTVAGSYASYVKTAQQRNQELADVRQLAAGRYPWEQLLGQIGGLMPATAALTSLQAATASGAGSSATPTAAPSTPAGSTSSTTGGSSSSTTGGSSSSTTGGSSSSTTGGSGSSTTGGSGSSTTGGSGSPTTAGPSSSTTASSSAPGAGSGSTGAGSSPSVSGASGAAASPLPAVQLSGCAASQSTVAQTMVALHRIPGVTDVTLSSATDSAAAPTSGTASTSSGQGGSGGCPFPVQFQVSLTFSTASGAQTQ